MPYVIVGLVGLVALALGTSGDTENNYFAPADNSNNFVKANASNLMLSAVVMGGGYLVAKKAGLV